MVSWKSGDLEPNRPRHALVLQKQRSQQVARILWKFASIEQRTCNRKQCLFKELFSVKARPCSDAKPYSEIHSIVTKRRKRRLCLGADTEIGTPGIEIRQARQ